MSRNIKKFDDACSAIEKAAGFCDESTAVGSAWAAVKEYVIALEEELRREETLTDAYRQLADKLAEEATQAMSGIWRVMPNSYTIRTESGPEPDPFEGPGETYADAYCRLAKERPQVERLREALSALYAAQNGPRLSIPKPSPYDRKIRV